MNTIHRGAEAPGPRGHALFSHWLTIAAEERATDIHVQIDDEGGRVLLRVDGELGPIRDGEVGRYPAADVWAALESPFGERSSVIPNANFDNLVTPPLAVSVAGAERRIQLRYKSVQGFAGQKVVMRLIDVDEHGSASTFEQLGFAEDQASAFAEAAQRLSGLIVVGGATGSGRTRSLSTFVDTHPGRGRMSFYSIESPADPAFRGVSQVRPIHSPQARARDIEGLLRRAPDVVLIDQVLDRSGGAACERLVETGHQAVAALHAHRLSGIVPRLTVEDIGMNREVLVGPNALALLVYQGLVPTLCLRCCFNAKGLLTDLVRRAELPDGDAEAVELVAFDQTLGLLRGRLELDVDAMRFRNEAGCSACGGRGTTGMTVVAEVLAPDERWRELTREGDDFGAMQHFRSMSDGRIESSCMVGKTVFEQTLYKATLGQVDPRQAGRFDSFARFLTGRELGFGA